MIRDAGFAEQIPTLWVREVCVHLILIVEFVVVGVVGHAGIKLCLGH